MENNKRLKISSTLKEYFKTEKGILHKRKLSLLQHNRMSEYAQFIKNKKLNINDNEKND